ncbi:MAG: ParB/RepB/Spo0J family partition protein [Desulfobacteraceae bacterium]|jgi:ParB family chromosome partitioning protein|nr:ParB/RepB/Spo0J family partition protein [Desulfobacteraceae bacterium]
MPTKDLSSTQLKSVTLSQIDTADDTYRITTRTNVDDLLPSISHDGVLNPPIVIEKSAQFTIVSGFRRITACKKLGFEEMTVRALQPDLNPLEYLRIAIADNTLQRPIDLIEASRSLHKLSVHLSTRQRLIEFASSLGLPSNPAVIKKIKDLCLLPQRIQNALMTDTLSLSMAMDLKKLPPACAVAFTRLFDEFKLSLNKQREIMTLVKEIARRDSISEQKVLEDPQLQGIILDRDLDRGQKAQQLRAFLRQRRFPRIVKAETIFEYQRKQLNLGNEIKIIPPKDFEGTTYTVAMSFSSIDQLKALHAKLDQMIKHPSLKKIIEREDK